MGERRKHNRAGFVLLALLGLALTFAGTCPAIAATEVRLAWDPNGEPDLAGYLLRYGTEPGLPTFTEIDVGNVISNVVTGLDVNTTYYFVVHARDSKIVMEFALKKPAYRLLVNTQATLGAIGSSTGLFPSMSLGCGTPGNNISADNTCRLPGCRPRRGSSESSIFSVQQLRPT